MDWLGPGSPADVLIRSERFDDAIEELRRMRAVSPGDPSLGRAIEQVRDRQTQHALSRLGALEHVVVRHEGAPRRGLGPDDEHVLALIDGQRTLDDLLDASTLGRHRTVRSLSALVAGGIVRTTPPRTVARARAPGRAEATRRIMVADASPTQATLTRTLARLMLGRAAEFVTTASGPETVEAAKKEAPDLLIVEFMLSGMDGLETLRRAREAIAPQGLPAIVVCQRVEADFVRGRLPARAALVVRPIEKVALGEAISEVAPGGLLRAS